MQVFGHPLRTQDFLRLLGRLQILERAGRGADFVERLDSCHRAEKTPAESDVGNRKLTGASEWGGWRAEELCRVGILGTLLQLLKLSHSVGTFGALLFGERLGAALEPGEGIEV